MDLIISSNKVVIPYSNTIKATDKVVVRVFDDKKNMVDYKSTRLETVKSDSKGFYFYCKDEFSGFEYELKVLNSRQVLKGKLLLNKAVAEVSTNDSKK